MHKLDENIIGIPARNSYSVSRRESIRSLQTVKGKPRFKYKDSNSSYEIDIIMMLSDSEFASWQKFWAEGAGYGSKTFLMNLDISGYIEYYAVNVLDSWNGVSVGPNMWQVSMSVEVPAYTAFRFTFCDVIYGGPIDDLYIDTIYGGPIDNLSDDIIAPCEEVLDYG